MVGPEALTPGRHRIVFEYTYARPDDTFDIGIDLRTGVNDKDYKAPFLFNGAIDKLVVPLGAPQLAAADRQRAAQAVANAAD